jgi:hypothetical protein
MRARPVETIHIENGSEWLKGFLETTHSQEDRGLVFENRDKLTDCFGLAELVLHGAPVGLALITAGDS